MRRIPIYEGNKGSLFFYIIPHDRARYSERHIATGFSIDEFAEENYLAPIFLRHLEKDSRMNRRDSGKTRFYSIRDFRNILLDTAHEKSLLVKAYRNITGHTPGLLAEEKLLEYDIEMQEKGSEITSYSECLEAIIEFYERFRLFSEKMLKEDEKAPYILVKRN